MNICRVVALGSPPSTVLFDTTPLHREWWNSVYNNDDLLEMYCWWYGHLFGVGTEAEMAIICARTIMEWDGLRTDFLHRNSLTTDTVVRRKIASSQQGQTMAKSHNILLRRKWGTSGCNFYTIFSFPFLTSAISISHNIFSYFQDVIFSWSYWCPH